jgi:uncharacterized membrane protein
MAGLDTTNPLAVVVAFFGLMMTAFAVFIKFSALGIIGIFAGVGLFAKMMWGRDK